MDWENGELKIDLLFTKQWEALFWSVRTRDDIKQFHIDLAAVYKDLQKK